MRTVTLRGEVRLIDLMELDDVAFAVLARCKVRTLADWDRLLEKQQHRLFVTRNSPAEVLWDLSHYRLDYSECVNAVAVLAAAREQVGGAR